MQRDDLTSSLRTQPPGQASNHLGSGAPVSEPAKPLLDTALGMLRVELARLERLQARKKHPGLFGEDFEHLLSAIKQLQAIEKDRGETLIAALLVRGRVPDMTTDHLERMAALIGGRP